MDGKVWDAQYQYQPDCKLVSHSPLFLLSLQLDIGSAIAVCTRLAGMFRPIEDIDVPADRLGSYQVGVLRHVSRPVDLVLVVDALNDPNTSR